MIKRCTCNHPFQDSIYGKGMRVHTEGKKGEERCTVCGPKPRNLQRVKACADQWQPGMPYSRV